MLAELRNVLAYLVIMEVLPNVTQNAQSMPIAVHSWLASTKGALIHALDLVELTLSARLSTMCPIASVRIDTQATHSPIVTLNLVMPQLFLLFLPSLFLETISSKSIN